MVISDKSAYIRTYNENDADAEELCIKTSVSQ